MALPARSSVAPDNLPARGSQVRARPASPKLAVLLDALPVVGVQRLTVTALELAPQLSMPELGALLERLLAHKPLYLEQSPLERPSGGVGPLRRRADAVVLHALGRALSLIAQRCRTAPRAYASRRELVRDLTKLAEVTRRIVERRRALPPVVCVVRPRPGVPRRARLPKVMLQLDELE